MKRTVSIWSIQPIRDGEEEQLRIGDLPSTSGQWLKPWDWLLGMEIPHCLCTLHFKLRGFLWLGVRLVPSTHLDTLFFAMGAGRHHGWLVFERRYRDQV